MSGHEAYLNLGINNEQDQTMRNYLSMFPEEVIASVLDAFIINKPMNGKVGGDGFWVHQLTDELIVALFDCMGHGHLASMMTRVYTQFLDKIIKEEGVIDPGTILRYLHHRIATKFKDGGSKQRVGTAADFGIIKINLGIRKIEYAGAKIDLIHVVDHELKEVSSNRMPIGDLFDFPRKYQTELIELSENAPSNIYLSSDGFKDLIGGPRSKKLGKKAVQSQLQNVYGKPMLTQKELLNNFISEWQGADSQTDDMLMLGLAI